MPINSFNYIADARAKVLILGSIPGVKSLEANEYYAHPQNSFWWILSQLLNINLTELGFEQRYKVLKKNNIALWDVIAQCEREGSLDSAININTLTPNDFESFFEQYNNIQTVYCNGGTAYKLFKKHFANLQKEVVQLPSTSPAYAAMKKQEKLEKWKIILE